jgi:hypothetical protein
LGTSCKKTPFTCEFSKEKVIKTIDLQQIDTIEINPLIELKVYDTTFNKMQIEVSKDVRKNISYKIIHKKLIINNNTDCLIQNKNAVASVKLYVTDLKCIIANTDLSVASGNLWQFDQISLICENHSIGSNNIADFNIQAAVNKMKVTANGTSIFTVTGTCNDLNVSFYGVNPIFKGQNFKAQNITVFQRSDADMHLFPIQSISGDLYGYGDIYLYNRPPQINIRQHYAGHIYFVN